MPNFVLIKQFIKENNFCFHLAIDLFAISSRICGGALIALPIRWSLFGVHLFRSFFWKHSLWAFSLRILFGNSLFFNTLSHSLTTIFSNPQIRNHLQEPKRVFHELTSYARPILIRAAFFLPSIQPLLNGPLYSSIWLASQISHQDQLHTHLRMITRWGPNLTHLI